MNDRTKILTCLLLAVQLYLSWALSNQDQIDLSVVASDESNSKRRLRSYYQIEQHAPHHKVRDLSGLLFGEGSGGAPGSKFMPKDAKGPKGKGPPGPGPGPGPKGGAPPKKSKAPKKGSPKKSKGPAKGRGNGASFFGFQSEDMKKKQTTKKNQKMTKKH